MRAQAPKLPRRLLDVLSREEVARLEDAAKTERDKLIVRVLADAGLRVTELTGLRVTDLIERDRKAYLRVRGKADRERDVPVMPQLGRRLRRHVERGRPRGTTSDRVFVSLRRGRSGDYARSRGQGWTSSSGRSERRPAWRSASTRTCSGTASRRGHSRGA